MPSREIARQGHRNHAFDLMRIVFACLVILGHAPALVGNLSPRAFVFRLAQQPINFATGSVDGFFLLSGYLIVQSWQSDPVLLNFLRKRVLRIVPGYGVAVALSVLLAGLLAPGVPHFFLHLRGQFLYSVLRLDAPATPLVFPGSSFAVVNASLWSIAYEFRCYLLVAILGVLGLLRFRFLWLALTLLSFAFMAHPASLDHALFWPQALQYFIGAPGYDFRLTPIFLVGGCFLLFRRVIPFRPLFAILAVALLVLAQIRFPSHFEEALAVFGAYLMFYLGQLRTSAFDWMSGVPDISYGIYLYGWPVEKFCVWYLHTSVWPTFLLSLAVCVLLGWLSWHFVERPMLKLKRRSLAPLPPP